VVRSQLQFTEYWQGRTGLSIGLREVLYSETSAFQRVEVFETDILGRALALDGAVMFTEFDEFVYHEMIAHPALSLLHDARRVLIIGGGDGGAAREALRHPDIETLDLVDIDEMVAEVARRFFPNVSSSLSDPRLALHIQDGRAFVEEAKGDYDLIVVDSTDPFGVAEALFSRGFYESCRRLLAPKGILVAQSESPFDPSQRDVVEKVSRSFREIFPIAATYLAFIPTYATGMWSFTLASKRLHPLRDYDGEGAGKRLKGFGLKYYNPEIHRAAFALPTFVRHLISDPGDEGYA
jgi:spermidine synthase